MKKLLPLITILLTIMCSKAQEGAGSRATVYNKIAMRQEQYNNPASQWKFVDSTTYFYNGEGKQTSFVSLTYNSGWNDYYKEIFTYDSHGNRLTLTQQYWNGTTYRNTYLITSTFDTNDNMLTDLYQHWDSASNNWRNQGKNLYTYNVNNKMTEEVTQQWNTGSNSWENSGKRIFTYNINGNVESLITQDWISGAWVNSTKQLINTLTSTTSERIHQEWSTGSNSWTNTGRYLFTTDANQRIVETVYANWNVSVWDTVDRTIYTYNASGFQLSITVQDWTGSAFVNEHKDERTYDGSNNLLKGESFNWQTAAWVPFGRTTGTYDNNNNNTYSLNELYNTNTLTYEPTTRYYYFYEAFNTAISETKNELGASLYPNPSGNMPATLNLNIEQPTRVVINVYDMAGRVMSSERRAVNTGANNMEAGFNQMPTGNYILQITDLSNQKTSVLKMVKE